MNRRFALLVDGGFLCKRLQSELKRPPDHGEVLGRCRLLASDPSLDGHELLRIYYYDAPPATGTITNPLDGTTVNLGRTDRHKSGTALQDALELSPDVALRKGELAIRGWKIKRAALDDIAKRRRNIQATDLVPNLQQKGVDLRIGLDIARLSVQRMVDALVVITGDSDLVPALRFARREGVRVYVAFLGAPVKRELEAHADRVL